MRATFITTTPRSSVEALRYQGITVSENHAQLQSMLQRNLSPEHALFFAEPVLNSAGTSVDWYTSLEGKAVPLDELPPEERQAALQEIRRLAGDINELAEGLKQGGEGSKSVRGNILSLALRYPGQEYLYVVGKQPVLLCWGFSAASASVGPEDLMRLGAAAPLASVPLAPVPEPTAPPPPETSSGWLRSLLFLLLGLLFCLGLLFLAGLLLGRSGCPALVSLPVVNATKGCSSDAGPVPEKKAETLSPEVVSALTAEQEKERSLRRQLDDLRRQLSARLAECPRPKKEEPRAELPKPIPLRPEEPKAPEVAPDPDPPAEPPALADLMPTTPEPPKEPPAPKEKPAPKEPPAPQKAPELPKPKQVAKGDTLEIPDGAREKNDLSFLEGCWYCETGLFSSATGEPVTVLYCFDANGQGSRTIQEKRTGGKCQGSVRAQFDSSGQLRIRGGNAKCTSGGAFVPQTVECQQQGKKASCFGREDSGRNTRWRATFRRT